MATSLAQITFEEFERMPEGDRKLELVDGVLVEKEMANADHEIVKGALIRPLVTSLDPAQFEVLVEARHRLARNTGREPDLAIWRTADLDTVDPHRTLDRGPLVAIEVVSSETAADLQYKIAQYFAAGTELVWTVYPRTRVVYAQWRDRRWAEYGLEDTLDAGETIPGLKIPVAVIFARLIKLEAAHPSPR